ncbi:hypothetical protein VC83_03274 [Pseudogymnoascus destructans]|uniref:Cytidyltransferase-like domain-containing protein n=2 Tax=Pseudogymnoascus destructans TaxID=655981 RepID=L8GAF2_PSED2|nr:uncharacterized protein VC83_03274 [Pseudogymnoascus destructans]ELR09879.1 hypothetical protein GMDG_04357 [Pseudogymnoascus destructans 20631-21]OAF60624.1 hypothetical protein VC83_03274 [Pseudogymnoascus destructans]
MSTSSAPSLLLLPPPPQSLDRASLKAAYLPAFTAALCELASARVSPIAVLDIAVPWPALREKPRSHLFKETQHLLAELYSLISVVCAQKSIDLDCPGGIDPRVLLVEYDSSQPPSSQGGSKPVIAAGGPIIDLQTVALTRRTWTLIFTVDGEQGQQVFHHYSTLANAHSTPLRGHIRTVPGGTTVVVAQTTTQHNSPPPSHPSAKTHAVVAVGGTFDHLHAGHKLLLTATALMLQPPLHTSQSHRRLIIGITGDELLKNKKYAEQLESWKRREEGVVNFLLPLLSFTTLSSSEDITRTPFGTPVVNGRGVSTHLKSANLTIECVEIQDPFGPTITDASVSALVVSGETRDGGAAVNTKREEKGWEALEVFEIDVLDSGEDAGGGGEGAEGFAAKISSTAIRRRRAEESGKASL